MINIYYSWFTLRGGISQSKIVEIQWEVNFFLSRKNGFLTAISHQRWSQRVEMQLEVNFLAVIDFSEQYHIKCTAWKSRCDESSVSSKAYKHSMVFYLNICLTSENGKNQLKCEVDKKKWNIFCWSPHHALMVQIWEDSGFK